MESGQKLSFLKAKKREGIRAGGDRIRRSVDGANVSNARQTLRDEISMSMSMGFQGNDNEPQMARMALRATSPAFFAFSMKSPAAKNLLVKLDSADPHDWETLLTNKVVGAKALHLAEMMAHAKLGDQEMSELIVVPKAACVTTFAYEEHIRRLKLEEVLQEILFSSQQWDADEVSVRLSSIRDAIVKGPLCSDLSLALADFLNNSHFDSNVRFAVRSSSTQEDTGSSSFAGQYETYLNVPREHIGEAIRKCWASMWNERLLAYRKNVGFSGGGERLAMAVVVQQQVDSNAAGVAFSMCPVTGNADHVVVESVWGQGEGLVGGTITPHSFKVSWRGGEKRIVHRTTAEQKQKIVLHTNASNHGFTETVETSEKEKKTAPLTDAQAMRVAEMALRVSESYGVPYDIEWARYGDNIYLLQARPITSFAVDVEDVWDYAGFDDSSVLTLSMSAHAYAAMMSRSLPPDTDKAHLSLINYCRAYINSDLWRSFSKRMKQLRRSMKPHEIVAETVNLVDECSAKATELRKLDATKPENLIRLLEGQDEFNTASFRVGDAADHFEKILDGYIRWLNESCGESLSLAGIVDGINVLSEAAFSSHVLAALADVFHAEGGTLESLIKDGGVVEQARSVKGDGAKACMGLFDQFIDRFFFMSNRDEDVSGKRWCDDQSVPWTLLSAQVRGLAGSAPKPKDDCISKVLELLTCPPKTIVSHETDIYRKTLQDLKDAVRRHLSDNLDGHFNMLDSSATSLRKVLHEKERIHVVYTVNNCFLRRAIVQFVRDNQLLGDAVHVDGRTILQSHAIFCLDFDSLRNLLSPKTSLAQRRILLADAKRMQQMMRGLTPPSQIGRGVDRHVIVQQGGDDEPVDPDATFSGVGCSAGVVTGKAVLVSDLSQAGKLSKGDILLTNYTDPSWSPLFSLAAGVVLVDGGILSHAAVVAREMKIPCVVQVKRALTLSDKVITLDGGKGTIIIKK